MPEHSLRVISLDLKVKMQLREDCTLVSTDERAQQHNKKHRRLHATTLQKMMAFCTLAHTPYILPHPFTLSRLAFLQDKAKCGFDVCNTSHQGSLNKHTSLAQRGCSPQFFKAAD